MYTNKNKGDRGKTTVSSPGSFRIPDHKLDEEEELEAEVRGDVPPSVMGDGLWDC